MSRKVLVTGASGYVGGRLVGQLVGSELDVRVLVRDPRKIQRQPWIASVDIVEGSADDQSVLLKALAGVHTAFYLLHSIGTGSDFDETETRMATEFAQAARTAGVSQIVYLGGIANDTKVSKHLASRASTGSALASTGVSVLELRAGIIIGSGSASFEMLRHLTHRLPIMTTPKWVLNRTQPIGIRDVLWYLLQAAQLPSPIAGVYDIAGTDIMTYEEMMQTFARVSGLRKRIIIKVPVLTPWLSSLWIGLVTPVPSAIARPLIGSLISEVVSNPEQSVDQIIPRPERGLMSLEAAITMALSRVNENAVKTRWSDASVAPAPWQKAQGDPSWAGEKLYVDRRELVSDASLSNVWSAVERIGGNNGWYGADLLWYLRGLLDRAFGGVGLRRGRRDPVHLEIGDSLDFWRVEALEPQNLLRLYAEMILPGKAWLEFRLSVEGNQVRIVQEAQFAPRGLGGNLYWWAVSPFHRFVFPTMLKNIVKAAELAKQ
ncbi:MAG: DUF2867 domain-containing protein [Actinobacteria bacterium]|uniref:Unannotated protein n=1 Tax=freshwater metagenome TaxID=449393 RepID=A0A6J5YKG7_9ZZZZ|nr:DUF2867 domain-containing protein [Actinomycetota bacterium]